MRNFFTILGILMITVTLSNAQITSKGSSCMQIGYGYPSAMQLMGSVFKFAANAEDQGDGYSTSFKYKGFGPLHFRYDYMLGGRVGLGLSANYEMGNFKFTNSYLDIDDNQVTDVVNFHLSSINAMARMNFHFIKNPEKVDIYYGFGVGYAHTRVKLEETLGDKELEAEAKQDVDDFNDYLNGIFKMFPVAFEEVFGLKVPFGQSAGMYFEVGYSKAICQLGFYAKISEPRGFNSGRWKWF